MKYFYLFSAYYAATVIAVPLVRTHEKREHAPPGWIKHDKVDATALLPTKVALKQSNLARIHNYLMDVSHPESAQFGQYWNTKQVAEAFMPSKESIITVTEWLVASGIRKEKISKSPSLGWLQFNATVEEAERLLDTDYYRYKHQLSGKSHVACSEYSLPEHVQDHIDFITPTVHFDAKVVASDPDPSTRSKRSASSQDAETSVKRSVSSIIGSPSNGWMPKKGITIGNLTYLLDLI